MAKLYSAFSLKIIDWLIKNPRKMKTLKNSNPLTLKPSNPETRKL